MNVLGRTPDQRGGVTQKALLGGIAGLIMLYPVADMIDSAGEDEEVTGAVGRVAKGVTEVIGGVAGATEGLADTASKKLGESGPTTTGGADNAASGDCGPFAGMDCGGGTTTAPNDGTPDGSEKPFTFRLDDGREVICGLPLSGAYNYGDAAKQQSQLRGTDHAWALLLDGASVALGTHPPEGSCSVGGGDE